jgi:predicted SAM-dependent methyltransferase
MKQAAKRALGLVFRAIDGVSGKAFGAAAPVDRQLFRMRFTGEGRPFLQPPNDGKIRLNLGSGDKTLPGYVNVDTVDERAGNKPDVISDIRKLELADEYADEVMAIHVVEHFYIWEIAALLAEWRRVLKPGGLLILECPNVLKAARNLVNNPSYATNREAGWKKTMHALYGDTRWEDALMVHKWGWTPASLTQQLEEAGFSGVHEEVAIFHSPIDRDMRLVGVKSTLPSPVSPV